MRVRERDGVDVSAQRDEVYVREKDSVRKGRVVSTRRTVSTQDRV